MCDYENKPEDRKHKEKNNYEIKEVESFKNFRSKIVKNGRVKVEITEQPKMQKNVIN